MRRNKGAVQVNRIIAAKQETGKQYYKVNWIDRPEAEASWVETTQLENCEDLLEEFRREKGKRIRVRVPRFQTSHAMTTGIDTTDGYDDRH